MRPFRLHRTAAALLVVPTLVTCPAFGQSTSRLHPAVDPSHDLTATDFLKDIGANFAALIDKRSIVPLVGGAGAVSLATIPEQDLERHFARGDIWGAWSEPGRWIGHPVMLAGISGTLFAASRKSSNQKFRSLSYSLVHGIIMTESIAQTSKVVTHRLRPSGEDHKAFPSGHSTDSFVYATILADHYGWKAALPAFTVAAYVSATRLEQKKHHLTDVVAGAVIGILAGRTVSRRIHGSKASRFTWHVYPSRRGFTASVQVNLTAPPD